MKKPVLITNEGHREILIHGPIGGDDGGITGEDFTNALNKFPKGTKVTVGINSPGGSVGEGLAIYNAIERRSKDITARVDGYALSIASVFMQAAGRRVIPKAAIVMAHRARGGSFGTSDQMRKDAEMVDKHDGIICTAYCVATGKDEKTIQDMMEAETWFTGAEAVDYGLGDETNEEEPDFGPIDASRFKNCPQNFKTILNCGTPKAQLASLATTKTLSAPISAAANINDTTKTKMNTETNVPVNGTGEQLVAPKNSTDTDNAASASLMKLIAEQSAALTAEKRKRVTAEVIRLGENKIANDQIQNYVDLAMDNEDRTFGMIKAMHVATAGNSPLASGIQIKSAFPLDEISKLPSANVRFAALRKDWDGLIAEALVRDERGESYRGANNYTPKRVPGRQMPENANTFSSTLTTAFLADGAVTNLQNRWAPLMAFTRDFTTDPYKPRATAQIKNVTATTAAAKNATNFETAAGDTVAPISVTVDQYSKSFDVSNTELNSGLRMENLITINTAGISDSIIQTAITPITNANFANPAKQVIAPNTMDFSKLQNLWAALKKSNIRNIILDGEYLAGLINVPTFFQQADTKSGGGWSAFGWDYIALNTNWTTADAGVRGFACHPQAICCVAGLPLTPPNIPGNTLSVSTAQIPDVNITIAVYQWFALASRTMFCSYDVMFGAAAGDTTAGVIVSSS